MEAAGRGLHGRHRRSLTIDVEIGPRVKPRGSVIYAGDVTDTSDSANSVPASAVSTVALSMRQRITLAALGGVYLGFTVAWLFATQANQFDVDDRFQQSMMSFGAFFAIIAAPLYFFTTMVLVRNWSGRLFSLLVGLVVLFPFPLLWGVVPA